MPEQQSTNFGFGTDHFGRLLLSAAVCRADVKTATRLSHGHIEF